MVLSGGGVEPGLDILPVGGGCIQIEHNNPRLMLFGQTQTSFGFFGLENSQSAALEGHAQHFALLGGCID